LPLTVVEAPPEAPSHPLQRNAELATAPAQQTEDAQDGVAQFAAELGRERLERRRHEPHPRHPHDFGPARLHAPPRERVFGLAIAWVAADREALKACADIVGRLQLRIDPIVELHILPLVISPKAHTQLMLATDVEDERTAAIGM
jgi:hypothetical protein